MSEQVTRAIVEETAAEIEALRTAFVALAAHVMRRSSMSEREELLRSLQDTAEALPRTRVGQSLEAVTFYAEVADRVPDRMRQLLADVRKELP